MRNWHGRLSPFGRWHTAGTSLAAQVAALFGPSDTGWFYDNADLSTMFQDRAGTTPVTAAGQSVGLQLDKSKGLVLGPELVTNGTFVTDTSGWAADWGNIAWLDGQLETTSTGSTYTGRAVQVISTQAGRHYRVTGDIVSASSAQARVAVANGTGSLAVPIAEKVGVGPVSFIFAAQSNQSVLTLRSGTTANVDKAVFDNISVRELPGNHAVQATALSRPTFQTGPARLTDDGGDSLNVTFPAGNYTVIYAGSTGDPVVLTSQAYSGATDVLLSAAQVGYFAINRALSASEEAKVVAWLRSNQT